MPSSAARTGRRSAAYLSPVLLLFTIPLLLGCSPADDPAGAGETLGSEPVATTSAPTSTPTPPPALADADADSDDDGTGPDDAVLPLSTDPAVTYESGTCHHQPAADVLAQPIPCDDPHTIEVYAVEPLEGGPSSPFQGLDAALEVCDRAFRQLTGASLAQSTVFQRSVIRPSEETWADGERSVTCYVVYPQFTDQRLADIDPLRSFGRVSTFGLLAGDCLIDFDEQATWFTAAPCDDPHDAEVFAQLSLADGPFPGQAALQAQADELCYGQPFTDFVGRDYGSSSLSSLVSQPTAETWAHGDRRIICILTDELVRTGSFRDSEL